MISLILIANQLDRYDDSHFQKENKKNAVPLAINNHQKANKW